MLSFAYTTTSPPDALKTELTQVFAVTPPPAQSLTAPDSPPGSVFTMRSYLSQVAWGDLPREGASPYTASIFVYLVTNPDDPKADVFLRVANVSDLANIPTARPLHAPADGSTPQDPDPSALFRSQSCALTYTSIAEAAQAKKLLHQRVDNLVADWRTYAYEFLGLTQPPYLPVPTHSHPTEIPLIDGIVQARKDAYYAAASADDIAANNLATATTNLATANADVATTQSNLISLEAQRDFVKQCRDLQQAAEGALATYRTAADTAFPNAVTDASAYATANATRAAAAATFTASGAAQYTEVLVLLNGRYNELNDTEVPAAGGAVIAANAAVASATTALATATATKAQTTAEKQAALDAVLEVCPDFTP